MEEKISPLVLAYLGDSVYECYVRKYLIKKGLPNVKELQKASLAYVSAKSQAEILKWLFDIGFFLEEEKDIIRHARNTKNHRAPKGCDILTYKRATALEALVGYFSIRGDEKRIEELMNTILEREL